ncbi:phosphoribosyltransferase-like protein [Spongiimicrobium sp. 2-473A-2-J]|uniref:phosphoribosyltransferase-like protein n=1 Tax=Eudoraea algarum TaxID=3417568 RepID=UPI003D35EE5C
MRKKLETKFDFKQITELRNVFVGRNWANFDEFESFFDNFCSISEHLDQTQANLVLELTDQFLWLRETEYYSIFKKVLIKLSKIKHLNLNRVYVIPMLSPTDREGSKTKSSRVVAYLCRSTLLKFITEFKSTEFIIVDDLKHLPNHKKVKKNNHPVILVDDFVGTGDTATEALEEIIGIQKYSNETLFILSLVSQRQGIKAVNDMGYHLLTEVVHPKGISERYDGKEELEKKKIMKSIEDILAISKNYRFGYKGSEALVSMIRTPNNTFPMYWWNCKLEKGKKWNAPFPR